MHFYPPFLFTKCYLDISRRATFHFDGPSLNWIPGEYFSLGDIFTNLVGKLRIGIEYKIESFFDSILWYIFLIFGSILVIAYNELRQNMKLSEKSGFFLFEIFRTLKTAINIFKLKNINIKRERLENEVNKIYDKFNKNYQISENAKKNPNKNSMSVKTNQGFDIQECKILKFLKKFLNLLLLLFK